MPGHGVADRAVERRGRLGRRVRGVVPGRDVGDDQAADAGLLRDLAGLAPGQVQAGGFVTRAVNDASASSRSAPAASASTSGHGAVSPV